MKYLVLTTCCHGGFALLDSATDTFNSAKTTAGRNFAAGFVATCRKHELERREASERGTPKPNNGGKSSARSMIPLVVTTATCSG